MPFFNCQFYVTSSSPTLGCYWSSESCQPIGFDLTLHFYCVLNDQNFCRSLASITLRNVPEHQQNKICCNTQYEASNEIPISDRQLMLQIIVQILGERAWTKGAGVRSLSRSKCTNKFNRKEERFKHTNSSCQCSPLYLLRYIRGKL